MWKTSPSRLVAIFLVTFLLSFAGLNTYKAFSQNSSAVNITPFNTIYTRGTETGQVVTVSGSTSVMFAGVSGQRHYVTQAICIGTSSTAQIMSIYDGGTTVLASIPCTTSYTTGAYRMPVDFNPPLEGSSGNAVNVGVGTAAQSTNMILNGFKGVR